MRGLFEKCLLTAALVVTTSAAWADLSGVARVIDGDTLEISGTHVRLAGLDAPENDQQCRTEHGVVWDCGRYVTQELRSLLGRAEVRCVDEGDGGYGRVLGRCYWGVLDLSAHLVGLGLAWVDPRFEQTYLSLEKEAAIAQRGLWAMSSSRPWAHPVTRVVGRTAPDADCVIKGNISDGGRIYHLPGQQHYLRTGIRPENGERWFCTTQEAERAGWRAARR
jgi:endonuclease YncB( thermonuclease family)